MPDAGLKFNNCTSEIARNPRVFFTFSFLRFLIFLYVQVIFKHRAKVYRYDGDAKQWKERGVGDVKILKHPGRGTFRILLRREQVTTSATVVICQSYQ